MLLLLLPSTQLPTTYPRRRYQFALRRVCVFVYSFPTDDRNDIKRGDSYIFLSIKAQVRRATHSLVQWSLNPRPRVSALEVLAATL